MEERTGSYRPVHVSGTEFEVGVRETQTNGSPPGLRTFGGEKGVPSSIQPDGCPTRLPCVWILKGPEVLRVRVGNLTSS